MQKDKKMIRLELDHHDFLFAVEGFASGSHLRQHVWREIVYNSIPQMTDDDLDYLWYFMRRDLTECYVCERNGTMSVQPGHEEFQHALAALHRGNRYTVTYQMPGQRAPKRAICYRYNGEYYPLFNYLGRKTTFEPFGNILPKEWIKGIGRRRLPENKYVAANHAAWWTELPE